MLLDPPVNFSCFQGHVIVKPNLLILELLFCLDLITGIQYEIEDLHYRVCPCYIISFLAKEAP